MNPISGEERDLEILSRRVEVLEMREGELLRQVEEVRNSLREARREFAWNKNRRLPISCLPNELLGAIMEQVHVDRHGVDGDPLYPLFPVIASHVSSQWRAVAIGNSLLWTDMMFTSSKLKLQRIQAFLERSSGCSLNVTWTCSLLGSMRYMDIVIPHACRWRQFAVRAPYLQADDILRHFRLVATPCLENIVITNTKPEREAVDLPGFRIFTGDIPKLSRVTLECVPLDRYSLPLVGVTHLRLSNHPDAPRTKWKLFVEILTSMPSLVDLRIRGVVVDVTSEDHIETLHIPALVKLDFGFTRHDHYATTSIYAQKFSAALSTPSLVSMGFAQMNISGIACFAEHSHSTPKHSTVKEIEFRDITSPTKLSANFFRAFPAVTCLSLFRSTSPTIFAILLEDNSPNSSLLWPELQTITFQQGVGPWIHELITARKTIGRPLTSIRVPRPKPGQPDPFEQLREHVEIDFVQPLED